MSATESQRKCEGAFRKRQKSIARTDHLLVDKTIVGFCGELW